jgi:hypothetical protein
MNAKPNRSRSSKSTIDVSERVRKRPDPKNWGMDELMSLREAVELHWPQGSPLTVASLRIAIRDGKLPVCNIAGKHLLTRRCLVELTRGERLVVGKQVASDRVEDERVPVGGMTKAEARAWLDEHARKRPAT